MRKQLFALLAVAALSVAAWLAAPRRVQAQQSQGSGAPSGGCSSGLQYLDTTNHVIYNCSNNAWVLIGLGAPASNLGLVSTYNGTALVANGIPIEVAKADLTAQAANIALTSLYAVPANAGGMYRVSFYAVLTAAGTTSTVPNLQINYTDLDSNTASNPGIASSSGITATNNTAGTNTSSTTLVNLKASSTLQWGTVNYASTGTAMQYAAHVKLEYLGN